MTFSEARELLEPSDSPVARIERFTVSGGMTRHLAELGLGDLRTAVCRGALDRRGPLFNDPRSVLNSFSITRWTAVSVASHAAPSGSRYGSSSMIARHVVTLAIVPA